jgi:integrase
MGGLNGPLSVIRTFAWSCPFLKYKTNPDFRSAKSGLFLKRYRKFASWLVQGGASLYEVQRLLGRSSAKVTEIYSHLQPEQMHETMNRISVSLD